MEDAADVLAILPKESKGLRACLLCSLIKQFEDEGCNNCDAFLRMRGKPNNVKTCTSSQFAGMIASMTPDGSWVTKWQRTSKYMPGIYAISVSGKLPDEVIDRLSESNINYENIQKIRDKTMA